MIKTVIFDIGKVLVYYDWFEYIDGLFGDPKVHDALGDAFFNHGMWNEFDRGILSTEEIIDRIAAFQPDYEQEIRKFFKVMPGVLRPQTYAVDWIRSLKAMGYQVLYLSNWSDYLLTSAPHLLDFIEETDGGIYSCDVKVIKPDIKIYQCLIDKYDLIPEECVFIDDKEENTIGAKAAGLEAILYETPQQTWEALMKLLGKK